MTQQHRERKKKKSLWCWVHPMFGDLATENIVTNCLAVYETEQDAIEAGRIGMLHVAFELKEIKVELP